MKVERIKTGSEARSLEEGSIYMAGEHTKMESDET